MKTKKKVAKKEKKRKELNENLFQDLLFEHTKFETLNNEGWVNKWIKERKDWSFELNKEVTPRKQIGFHNQPKIGLLFKHVIVPKRTKSFAFQNSVADQRLRLNFNKNLALCKTFFAPKWS